MELDSFDEISDCSAIIMDWDHFQFGDLTSDEEFNAVEDALGFPDGLLNSMRNTVAICQRCDSDDQLFE